MVLMTLGKITSIAVRGFLSIRKASMTTVPDLLVLVGGNGAGKSNFLEALRLLGWMQQGRLQDYVCQNNGASHLLFQGVTQFQCIEFEIVAETPSGCCRYEARLQHCPEDNTLVVQNEQWGVWTPESETLEAWRNTARQTLRAGKESAMRLQEDLMARTLTRLLSGVRFFNFQKPTASDASSRGEALASDQCLSSDGSNLATVLLHLLRNDERRYQLVVRQIQRHVPDFLDFDLTSMDEAGQVALQWRSRRGERLFGVRQTSENTWRLFCLMTLFNLPPESLPTIVCVEEPERGLHPWAVELVADCLKEMAMDRQVMVTTLSPDLVNCFEAENVFICEHRCGESQFHGLIERDWRQVMADEYRLSDVWLSSSPGGIC